MESVSVDPESGMEFAEGDGRRISDTAWVGLLHNKKLGGFPSSPVVEKLQRRVATLARAKMEQAEPLQVARYKAGGFYRLHQDGTYFGEYNTTRIATVLLYLDDVSSDAGGGTHFPFGGTHPAHDVDSCTGGRLVAPRKGDALLFYTIRPRAKGQAWHPAHATFDDAAQHAACTLESGEKHVANVWFHSADPTRGINWRQTRRPSPPPEDFRS